MAKVLQKLFWVAITFKRYHNTSGCGTGGVRKSASN